MKKYIAILLLALLVFNLAGYKVWFYYLEKQSNHQFSALIEENEYKYDDADLLTVKVPLSLPYTTNWADFERYDGSVEVNGKHYNYVKRKLSNDTLILLCLPNNSGNRITDVKNSFEKMASGAADNRTNTSNLLLKLLTAHYYNRASGYAINQAPVCASTFPTAANERQKINHAIGTPWHPPDGTV